MLSKGKHWVSLRHAPHHTVSAQPRHQSHPSPRLGLIAVAGRRRLGNTCVLRGSERRKVYLAFRLPAPPSETLLPGTDIKLSTFCSKKMGFSMSFVQGIPQGPAAGPPEHTKPCQSTADKTSSSPPCVLSAPFIREFQSIFQT